MTVAVSEDGDAAGRDKSPTKVAPHTLALRAPPARVTSFRRGAIIAIAAIGSALLAGVSWFALRSADTGAADADDDRAHIAASSAPDVLAAASETYGATFRPWGRRFRAILAGQCRAIKRRGRRQSASTQGSGIALDVAGRERDRDEPDHRSQSRPARQEAQGTGDA